MISVALASYNGEKYIVQQLQSIKDQSRAIDEVVVFDDGSTDNTVAVVRDFIASNKLHGWNIYQQEKNKGFCLNFYDAIFKTTGDYIFICDQDDVWHSDKVEKMVAIMERDSSILSLSSRHKIIDGEGNTIQTNPGITFAPQLDDGSLEEITVHSQIGCNRVRGCAMCIRGEVKQFITPIKLETLLSHDWLISILSSLNGKNLCYNKLLFSYRFHENNASLTAIKRKELVGDNKKRVLGLEQSITAYETLLATASGAVNWASSCEDDIKKQIKFEKRRLKFLRGKNPFVWLGLVFSLGRYARYYASPKGGIKIYLGDLLYAYRG